MKRSFPLLFVLAVLSSPLPAEPVSEGTYVDLVVVPIGPVALAEFEVDAPPTDATAKDGQAAASGSVAVSSKPQGPGGGGGSGIRVKEVSAAEIPPSALFVKRGEKEFLQIPCSLNAVGSPVRTPIRDSEVELFRRDGNQVSSMVKVGKLTVSQSGERLLVILTKPVTEKKWNDPKVSVFPLPRREQAQLMFVNASQELQCGFNVAGKTAVVGPLKPLAWVSQDTSSTSGVDVAIAMRSADDGFLPPFFQSNVELKPRSTGIYIAYGVSQQESFRGGKFATGTFAGDDFRPASPIKFGK